MTLEGTRTQPSVSRFVQGLLPNVISVVRDVSQIRTQGRYNSVSQGISMQEVMKCSWNIIHPFPDPGSIKSLTHYTVKSSATSLLMLEVSELKIRSLQISHFHSCITKSTQPQQKEMHKDRHRGSGNVKQRHLEEILPPVEEALVRNHYKEEIKFNPSHMQRCEEKDQSFSS